MKKLLIFVIGVIALVVVSDIAAGYMFDKYTDSHTLPGDLAPIDYMLKEADQDVIIIGNSAIINSLMPSVISDSTGLSIYNGGSNGQTLPFFHTMTNAILTRHTPKAIILGLQSNVLVDSGIGDRYNILTPYYGHGYSTIDSCLESTSALEPYLLKSTFYRYNGIWFRILLYHLTKSKERSADGFIAKPAGGLLPELNYVDNDGMPNAARMAELTAILEECRRRDIRVIVIWPPQYTVYTAGREVKAQANRLASAFSNVTIIDDSADSLFLTSPELFYDNVHLNADGALLYSKLKASQLKKINLQQ